MLEVAVVIATSLGALMAGGAYLIRRNLEKRERNTFNHRPAKLATRPGGTEASIYADIVRTIAHLEEAEGRELDIGQIQDIIDHLANLEDLESEISSIKANYVRQLLRTHSQPELFGAETGTAREPSTPVG